MSTIPVDPVLQSVNGSEAAYGAINLSHPYYDLMTVAWQQCRDTAIGQRAVKARDGGHRYLPPTTSMWMDAGVNPNSTGDFRSLPSNTKGGRNYEAYICRALFVPFVKDAVEMVMGMLWNKEASVQLPEKMKYLLDAASPQGETLPQLMRRVTYEQVVVGRVGLFVDMPTDRTTNDVTPYISLYRAEDIINWDDGTFQHMLPKNSLNLVVLDESGQQRFGFQWFPMPRFRVLVLGDLEKDESAALYQQGVYQSELMSGGSTNTGIPLYDSNLLKAPNIREKTLDFIPFTFIGSLDNTSEPNEPPLIGLSDIALSVYRTGADYRQGLFLTTQDTLFTKGFVIPPDKPLRVGAGAHVHSEVIEGDMKYVGVQSQGLPELRQAIVNDSQMAASRAGELMDASSRARESGTALEMRIGTKTATLNSIARAMGEGIARCLKQMALWMGLDPSEVIIQPNFEFASKDFAATDLLTLVQAKMLGGPMSFESIHQYNVDRGYTKLTYSEMLTQAMAEKQKGEDEEFQSLPSPDAKLQADTQETTAKLQVSAAKTAQKNNQANQSNNVNQTDPNQNQTQ